MPEAIATIQELTPLGAVIVLAGILASILTQILKKPSMTAAHRQLISIAAAVVIGLIAYVIVLGTSAGLPSSIVEAVSAAVVIIAGVALMSRAAYTLLGRTIPDGGAAADAPGVNPLSITVNGATTAETAQAIDTAIDVRDALDAPLVDTVAAAADARHGRRAATGVRATHAPVTDD